MNTHSIVSFLTSILMVFALLVPAAADEEPTTAQRCMAGQQRQAGGSCKGMARCYVKAMKKGLELSSTCIYQKHERLVSSIAEIEEEEDAVCLVPGEAGNVGAQVEAAVDDMANDLTLGGGRCAGRKMSAVGKACSGYVRCNATADARSESVDPSCIGKHTDRLVRSFNKAEGRPGCVTTGDESALGTKAKALADGVQVVFRGTGTTTTTSVSTSTTSTTL